METLKKVLLYTTPLVFVLIFMNLSKLLLGSIQLIFQHCIPCQTAASGAAGAMVNMMPYLEFLDCLFPVQCARDLVACLFIVQTYTLAIRWIMTFIPAIK